MYYPYLRGKQFELLALRELAQHKSDWHLDHICPIIEPVKKDLSSNSAAINALINAKIPFSLVLNPYRGDFSLNDNSFANSAPDLINHGEFQPKWSPAFLIDSNTEMICQTIQEKKLENITLIAQDEFDDALLANLIQTGKINKIIAVQAAIRKIRKISRNIDIIRLDDKFPPVKRNSDYRGKEDQVFSEEFAFFDVDGFSGFSDYTLITKDFADGGALPLVVAIHLTYSKTREEIRVRHFLSDSNSNGRENIQKKFAEAVEKVDFFFKNNADITDPVRTLIQFKEEGHYPGLGCLKKLSIEHHILLVNSLLGKNTKK